MKLRLLVLIGLTSLVSPTYAQDSSHPLELEIFGSSIGNNKYPNHFTISETAKKSSDSEYSEFQNPQDLLMEAGTWISAAANNAQISLVDFVNHRSPVSVPRARYDRREQFGPWAQDPDSCLNVRGMILQRTSEVTAKTRPGANGCTVYEGKWKDPYSGNTYTKPYPDIEVDHMVPIKNAYMMGASKWSRKKRCWYANFIKNDFHLIPISATENEIKSDSTPYDYMPARKDYYCQYVKNWLKVKMIWQLTMLPPEVEAIEKIVEESNCNRGSLKISKSELQKARMDIVAGAPFCR